jgi:hypothetical protein
VGSQEIGRAMSSILSRPGKKFPTKTAVWRDSQAWGIISQVRKLKLCATGGLEFLGKGFYKWDLCRLDKPSLAALPCPAFHHALRLPERYSYSNILL